MTTDNEASDTLKDWWASKNVYQLCRYFFNVEITPKQDEIVRSVAFAENKRVVIICMTRYGKCGKFNILVDDGRVMNIKDIQEGMEVLSLDESTGKIVKDKVIRKVNNGIKEVFELTTKTGRVTQLTANHPLLTPKGWMQLHELKKGDMIAVPRIIPFEGKGRYNLGKLKILGYMLGDGCLTVKHTLMFTNEDPLIIQEIKRSLPKKYYLRKDQNEFAYSIRLVEQNNSKRHNQHNLRKWFTGLGLSEVNSHTKRIPDFIFTLKNRYIAVLLNRMYCCDGWASVISTKKIPQLGYCSVSKEMIHQMQHLLLRFGILSSIHTRTVKLNGKSFIAYEIIINGKESILKFIKDIGIFSKSKQLRKIQEIYKTKRKSNECFDRIPFIDLGIALQQKRAYSKIGVNINWNKSRRNIGRNNLQKIAEYEQSEDIRKVSNNDILWDEVKDITYLENDTVWDIEIEKNHNFVADDIIVHNSYCLSMGILLWILSNKDKRIALIAPTNEKTAIIRNYIYGFIIASPVFSALVDLEKSGITKIKKEVSRKRITFKNGMELRMLSAEGQGEALMGFGASFVLVDEACDIDYEVYRSKITRMLGDDPDSIYVEISNPWHKDNHVWEHWINPDWKHIHIGVDIALKEARITEQFRQEQESTLTSMEYTILYKAEFPEESEDQLIKYSWIQRAIRPIPVGLQGVKKLGCDIARGGNDSTVLTSLIHTQEGVYVATAIEEHNQQDTMQTVSNIMKLNQVSDFDKIVVDTSGLGAGVTDRLRETKRDTKFKAEIIAYEGGKSSTVDFKRKTPEKKEIRVRFLNIKAEAYFHLRELFEEDRIIIPKHPKLIDQLSKMKWELTSSEKIVIKDPGEKEGDTAEKKSPDFSDSLCYGCWEGTKSGLIIQSLAIK
jgi:intein/homing endonuclease